MNNRRVEMREAALDLFSERGYYGSGMEDIAAALGLRASSLYNHVNSKHDLLADIMLTTMHELIAAFERAIRDVKGSAVDQVRAAMVAHVQYHSSHARDARIGNREIYSLREPEREEVKALRRQYARGWSVLIQDGVVDGVFDVRHPKLTTYAILEMGIGVAQWYRPDGELSRDEVAAEYAALAIQLLGGEA